MSSRKKKAESIASKISILLDFESPIAAVVLGVLAGSELHAVSERGSVQRAKSLDGVRETGGGKPRPRMRWTGYRWTKRQLTLRVGEGFSGEKAAGVRLA